MWLRSAIIERLNIELQVTYWLQRALQVVAYQFSGGGCFYQVFCRYGFDPRIDLLRGLEFQVIDFHDDMLKA